MLRKIKKFIESRKVTKLPTFADRACDYDYDLGYDPEYGDIGWYEPKDRPRERTASEQEAVDAAEKHDRIPPRDRGCPTRRAGPDSRLPRENRRRNERTPFNAAFPHCRRSNSGG